MIIERVQIGRKYVGTYTVFENHKKVSFNIASEASYIYIFSGQKFIKKGQTCSNLASFWKSEVYGQTVYQTGQF